ncbi:uncharacterized protein FIBRA_05201 [Fibroporia radiculosa]|uniref:Uncharacterized protein n=1 Tax=Fibroporia radiculosa TaxID=599839 RepID=J4IAK7_9APHY|nr:uncharacterized protein FIBRA_05201 [Fibroporia radiculosa]CCM03081.1 predicted protein [Fibroporia radiculosa]
MGPKGTAEVVPPSKASEPSEPSDIRPEEKPKEQLTGEQEENPQVTAHRKGEQAADHGRGSSRNQSKGSKTLPGGAEKPQPKLSLFVQC